MISSRWMLLGALVLGGMVGCSDSAEEAPPENAGGQGGSGGEGGSGGSGGDGGSGGSEDPGPGHCDDTRAEGEAIQSPGDDEWVWVDVPGAKCRDGSDTGFAINFSSTSKEVMIFLEGGGACFNAISCTTNPARFNEGNFNGVKASFGGMLDRTNDENPVKDWNYVYIPYCTGDVHAGNKQDVDVKDVNGKQQFVGYANIGLFLERIVPSFPEAERVLLTGVSAGGFGAAANYDQVQRGFGCTPVDLLDDAGPPMSKEYVPSCLQSKWRKTWGLDKTLLADCGEDCADPEDFFMDFMKHLATRHADRTQGLISSTADETIRQFYGFGANECKGFPWMAPEKFAAGLDDAREALSSFESFGSYVFEGETHTMIGSSRFYDLEVNDVLLSEWVRDLLAANPKHVGPEEPVID